MASKVEVQMLGTLHISQKGSRIDKTYKQGVIYEVPQKFYIEHQRQMKLIVRNKEGDIVEEGDKGGEEDTGEEG